VTHFSMIWLVTMVGLIVPVHLSFRVAHKGIGVTALAALGFALLKLYSLPLFSLGLHPLIFWLTPRITEGFHWREGLSSALINPVALSLLHSLAFWFLR
jgi:uncharacterized membrane protein YvlD (DUF360 family)